MTSTAPTPIVLGGPARLVDEVDALHAAYVAAINQAVARDDIATAEQLSDTYDLEVLTLMAAREGRLHDLPAVLAARGASAQPSRVRVLVHRLRHRTAA